MEVLAIIPARAGSKGLPGKNMYKIAGKPLIAYSIEVARKSKLINRVVVSTDSKKIGVTAKKYGAEIIMRPKNLALDATPTLPVLRHAVRFLKEKDGYYPDAVVLLQPPTPVRTAEKVDEAIEKLVKGSYNTIISVCEDRHYYWEEKKGRLASLFKLVRARKEQRHDIRPRLRETGSIYVMDIKTLMDKNWIFGKRIGCVRMVEEDSFDIHTESDAKLVEFLIRQKNLRRHS